MAKVIDLQEHRINKEVRLEKAMIDHYEQLMLYIKHRVNIREKVRAKVIFSEKVGCKSSSKFNTLEEQLFLNWFAFDYTTVQGLTIYQIFLKHYHRLDDVLHALFMVSVLEPYEILKKNEDYITAVNLQTNIICQLKYAVDSQNKSFFFARTVPIFDKFLCLGGIFQKGSNNKISSLLNDYNNQEKIGWRTYLKKYAIQYVWNGKTEHE
ncbi:hypothetical protein [Metabacillus fastidiosus]|uniref:hypothetical protein n=1 Tax=Metabacillus fastidiosus TaxID=1458 RepID=UPI002DBE4312|nr:hypothetical protein [Metabacillus fastidiosus]MEC2078246.1 hypothetical protein [Metabacillus fastidiosus]